MGGRDFEGCGFRLKEDRRNLQKLLKMVMGREVSKVITAKGYLEKIRHR